MEKIQNIRGTKDIFYPEILKWQYLEDTIRNLMKYYNFFEIRTPIFEETSLFARGIGDSTDIVNKEMYSFKDRSDLSLTLKPEMTAAVVRSFIQHNLGAIQPIHKFYYISPMFRQERPQAGRQRQFHQVGAEIFGTSNPLAEGELIILALKLLESVQIKNLKLEINSVGCKACRPKYVELLREYFSRYKDNLSNESKERIEKNPLRILDSKDERDIPFKENAPSLLDYLCIDCKKHFEAFINFLNENLVDYHINKNLVRGLDYYTKTAFEITAGNLGAQNAICGGGRYDLLVEELGGNPTPAVGWACGMERIILASELFNNEIQSKLDCYICFLSEDYKNKFYPIITQIRENKISCELDLLNRSLKAQMREANRKNARFALIIGEEEWNNKSVVVKDLIQSNQTTIHLDELINYLKTNLNN